MKSKSLPELNSIVSSTSKEMYSLGQEISALEDRLKSLRRRFTSIEQRHHAARIEVLERTRSIVHLDPSLPGRKVRKKEKKDLPLTKEVMIALIKDMPESELLELLEEA